ncbi:uncharacterized protein LOC131686795 [Topomyia yanbarensis]|uniref:uncharacterized protein LOC131686795 n=1 Tax=Topomyia yanbarensis TaxID=2498891 RepID=UPI00273C39A7|nr:uncharacterized protein LOC131686795 [Topomyia yanbarensis]
MKKKWVSVQEKLKLDVVQKLMRGVKRNVRATPDDEKALEFITSVGQETANRIIGSFKPNRIVDKTYAQIVDKFKVLHEENKNVFAERHRLITRKQEEGESLDDFAIDLQNIVEHCSVSVDTEATLVQSVFVAGIRNEKTRETMLRDANHTLNLAQLLEKAKTVEIAAFEARKMSKQSSSMVNYVGQNNSVRNRSFIKPGRFHESACSGQGPKDISSHRGNFKVSSDTVCYNCYNKGHLSYNCTLPKVKKPRHGSPIPRNNSVRKRAFEERINQLSAAMEDLKMSLGDENATGDDQSGEELDTEDAQSNWINNILLGRDWLSAIWPQWRETFNLNSLCESKRQQWVKKTVENLKTQYAPAFDEDLTEPIKGVEVDIRMDSNANPVVHKPYTVAFKHRDIVGAHLDDLEAKGILEKVEYTEWASPIVVVVKPNKKDIRIFIEELITNKSGAKKFALIDLRGAYQQLVLSEASKKLLVINTHQGLYAYRRLPFGVKPAATIFQSVMDSILRDIAKVQTYIDDILIWADSDDELLDKIKIVLGRLMHHNVKINAEKCEWFVSQVKYLGHILSEAGVSPNPEKVNAITAVSVPKSKTQLKSFLGMITFYERNSFEMQFIFPYQPQTSPIPRFPSLTDLSACRVADK